MGVPVLAGASAYAIAEAGGWRWGMDARPAQAKQFYAVIAVGPGLGMLLDQVALDGFRSLFWAAVIGGATAVAMLLALI